MFSYTIGKEEIAVELARHYRTKVVVDKNRYLNMQALGFHLDLFTLNPEEGFLHLTRGINTKKEKEKIGRENEIFISLSGWYNVKTYICKEQGKYLVAYSSHSNFGELEDFLGIVRPGCLSRIVFEK